VSIVLAVVIIIAIVVVILGFIGWIHEVNEKENAKPLPVRHAEVINKWSDTEAEEVTESEQSPLVSATVTESDVVPEPVSKSLEPVAVFKRVGAAYEVSARNPDGTVERLGTVYQEAGSWFINGKENAYKSRKAAVAWLMQTDLD
jgi:FlaG/FlaF family flagellin (archaellin)